MAADNSWSRSAAINSETSNREMSQLQYVDNWDEHKMETYEDMIRWSREGEDADTALAECVEQSSEEEVHTQGNGSSESDGHADDESPRHGTYVCV